MAAGNGPGRRWWDHAVGYEVYIRSFADGDGDGIGDLHGLLDRLDHLAWLGVDVVWVTPFYPTPDADHGYDVADYRDIDPRFGDLEVFDRLVERVHSLGMRLLVDLVPNHTSDRHPWFVASRSSRDDPHRDWYLWRDPAPDGGPPNNWLSHFGGPAWTLDEATGQYWCHLFLPEQPDLDWRNPEVLDAFDAILRFWLERGADGFRIDVAHALVKDAAFRDNPQLRPLTDDMGPLERFYSFDHVHDVTQPESLEIFRRWRAICDEHDAVLLGETYVHDAERLAPYLTGDGLHLGFWFATMRIHWDPDALRAMVEAALAVAPRGVSWPVSSHDDRRAPTRLGGGELGRRRALALTTLVVCLPGFPVLFQGDELALEDGRLPADALADPVSVRNDGALGRDGARVPVPWTPEPPSYGFSTSAHTWLPMGERAPEETVAVQHDDPHAPLHTVRRLLGERRELDAIAGAPLRWLTLDGPIVAFERGPVTVALNTADERRELALEGPRRERFSTLRIDAGRHHERTCPLEPAEAVVLVAEDG